MSTTETPDVATAPDAEPLGGKQMRFEGMPVKEHDVALTGLIKVDAAMAKDLRVGQVVKILATGKVVAKTHRYKKDADSGDRYVSHQATVKIEWFEDPESGVTQGEAEE